MSERCAWCPGSRLDCWWPDCIATDVPPAPPIGFEGRARAGADAAGCGGPFLSEPASENPGAVQGRRASLLLPEPTPAQRAWLQRVCREALDKRWQA
jgi:hypothetical protein